MTTRFKVEELYVEIDEESLALHDGDKVAPPNEVDDWYAGDLVAALDAGIATVEHAEIEMVPADEED